MKRLILLAICVFSIFPSFSQTVLNPPSGLKFYGKYLSEKQLAKIEKPEIIMDQFESFQHGYPQAGVVSYYKLKKNFDFYRNKYFFIQNDRTGRQWIHLSFDSTEYAVSHNELKNLLKPNEVFSFGDDSHFEFSFNLNISDQKNQLQFFDLYLKEPVKQTLYRILYKNGMIICDLPDFKDKAVKSKSKIPLGFYELGTEAKIRFQIKDKFLSILYNDYEIVKQPVTEDFPTGTTAYYQAGPYPDKNTNFFSEIFITDLSTNP